MVEAHCHPHSLSGSGFNIDVGSGVLAQGLHHERTDLSRNGPNNALGQACTIVRDDDAIAVLVAAKAFDRDDATAATAESVLEGVGQELVDDKPDRQRNIDGCRGMIDLEIEADSIRGVGIHDSGRDLTK